MSITTVTANLPLSPATREPGIPITKRSAEDEAGYQMGKALRSGDLKGAEVAYQRLAAFGSNGSGPWADPTMRAEFAALGQQIQSGDLVGAVKSFREIGNQQIVRDVTRYRHEPNITNQENLQGDAYAVFGGPAAQEAPAPVASGGLGGTAGASPNPSADVQISVTA